MEAITLAFMQEHARMQFDTDRPMYSEYCVIQSCTNRTKRNDIERSGLERKVAIMEIIIIIQLIGYDTSQEGYLHENRVSLRVTVKIHISQIHTWKTY